MVAYCPTWRTSSIGIITAQDAAAIVLAEATSGVLDANSTPIADAAWQSGLLSMIASLKLSGLAVLLLGDNPSVDASSLTPIAPPATHLTSVQFYSQQLSAFTSSSSSHVGTEKVVATAAKIGLVLTQQRLCSAVACPAMIDNYIAYFDSMYISYLLSTYIAPTFGAVAARKLKIVLGLADATFAREASRPWQDLNLQPSS